MPAGPEVSEPNVLKGVLLGEKPSSWQAPIGVVGRKSCPTGMLEAVGGAAGTTVLVATALVSPGLAVKTVQLTVRVPPGLLAVTAAVVEGDALAASWKSAAVGLPEPAVRVSVPVVAL